MQKKIFRVVETFALAVIALIEVPNSVWAGPPGPPSIPATQVGNAELSAVTVLAVAAYGYGKNRK